MKNYNIRLFLIGFLFFSLCLQGKPNQVYAQLGGISVFPSQVVFEGRTRSVNLNLMNKNSEPSTFRLSLQNVRMNENGEFVVITKPDPAASFADKMIRFSPKQVTLPPRGSQLIRILARKPRDLADGEYRTYLLIQKVPSADEAGQTIEQQAGDDDKLRIRIIPILGVSIAVIIRHGKLSSTVTLSDLSVTYSKESKSLPQLNLQLNRQGNQSSVGDIKVTFKPEKGEELEIGAARGIAVFIPGHVRKLKIPLRVPEGITLARGLIQVVYHTRGDESGKVLAQANLPLP